MKTRLQTIGSNIKSSRKNKKISQIELAVDVGIDRSYLSEIENGRTNLSINILYAIADALDSDIIEFFNNDEQSADNDVNH